MNAGASEAQLAAPAAGLVSFKTTRHALVSFAPNVVAERRVKRLKKSVWASGHLHGISEKGFRSNVCWFVTLTYRGVNDWCAEHMTKAIERFRHWCQFIGVPCRYTWVAELQNRGAVHYHLLAWLPVGVRMPQWDKRATAKRAAFWPHGMTNTQVAKAGIGYLMKYLSKLGEFHRFPKGLRLYGIGGLSKEGRATRSWLNLPEWTKRLHGVGEVFRQSGRLVVRATGEILHSPFSVSVVPGGLCVRLLGTLAERFHDGAYSTYPRVA